MERDALRPARELDFLERLFDSIRSFQCVDIVLNVDIDDDADFSIDETGAESRCGPFGDGRDIGQSDLAGAGRGNDRAA